MLYDLERINVFNLILFIRRGGGGGEGKERGVRGGGRKSNNV